jgi:hypothetical protein
LDGREMTLREYFEPRMVDGENPMGLGEVMKGIGWFVDGEGRPLAHPPPERNTRLRKWVLGCEQWGRRWMEWEEMRPEERAQAEQALDAMLDEVPSAALGVMAGKIREEKKARAKAEKRKAGK